MDDSIYQMKKNEELYSSFLEIFKDIFNFWC